LKNHLATVRAGERTSPGGKPVHSKILLAIPDAEFRLIRPELEFLDLPRHRILYDPNRKIEFIYLPNSGLISLVVAMQDSKTVEVGLMGNEGYSGEPAVFGVMRSPVIQVMQVAGNGFRIRAAALRPCLAACPELEDSLGRYSMVLAMQISQTAACNRLHDVEHRLARWLLMAQDRIGAEIAITHDFLATMLGTDRPTVSSTAAGLQRKGIIIYRRGSTTILNRKKLEACACECYGVIQQFNGEIEVE